MLFASSTDRRWYDTHLSSSPHLLFARFELTQIIDEYRTPQPTFRLACTYKIMNTSLPHTSRRVRWHTVTICIPGSLSCTVHTYHRPTPRPNQELVVRKHTYNSKRTDHGEARPLEARQLRRRNNDLHSSAICDAMKRFAVHTPMIRKSKFQGWWGHDS